MVEKRIKSQVADVSNDSVTNKKRISKLISIKLIMIV